MNAIPPTAAGPAAETRPVIVIGAGPVGLAAATHLIARGIPVRLLEAADDVAAHVRDWGHVKLFSPWVYNIDKEARALLQKAGWKERSEGRSVGKGCVISSRFRWSQVH